MMGNSKDNKTYIYDVGDKDKLRLKILNDVYNPLSQQALIDAGIQNKKCVLDIACGQGEMTCWIAKHVAQGGIVIGIDQSEEQLILAKQLANQQGLTNVQFLRKSVLEQDFSDLRKILPTEIDFIYCRWLLIHLESEKVKKVMRSFYDLLKVGGIIAHEEATLKESYLDKTPESFKQYVILFTTLAHKLNINFDLGSDLLNFFSDIGYKNLQFKISKPKFTSEQLYFFQLDLESTVSVLEKFKIANQADMEKLISMMAQDIKNGFDMTMTNYFVYGTK